MKKIMKGSNRYWIETISVDNGYGDDHLIPTRKRMTKELNLSIKWREGTVAKLDAEFSFED